MALCFVSVLPQIAGAATYYVSPGGSNGNTGLSTGQAWATIEYAEANAANGSTVYLMDGTFSAVTINRTGQSGRSSWDDAITFTPYEGAAPTIPQMTISGDYDRYLIFDGVKIDYPDTGSAIGDVVVLYIHASGYLQFKNMTIHGALQRAVGGAHDGEYATDFSTTYAVLLGNWAGAAYGPVTFENCDIGYTGISGLEVRGPISGPVVVRGCHIHEFGASGLTHDVHAEGNTCLYEGNSIYRQVHTWTAGYTTRHHGSGIHIVGDYATFRRNRVYLAGTSAAVRAYQGAVSGGYDGGVEINGSYSDAGQTFSYGHEVVQQGTGATGRYLRGSSGMVEIARATDGTTFNTVNPIVSSVNPSAIWNPRSIGNVRRWGGRVAIILENNLVYWGSNTWYKMELYDLAPGSQVINNTVIGSHVSTTGYNYFWYALHNVPALYYPGNIGDLKFCNNILVGHVDAFPTGATVVGNVMWGYRDGTSQTTLDSLFPGNKVYCWSSGDHSGHPIFTSSGQTFVGGTDFAGYAFQQPADSGDGFAISGAPSSLGDSFALAQGSHSVGFGSATHGTATDILGKVRDTPPDAGCYESQSDASGNHLPILSAIGNRSATVGTSITFQLTAYDADGDTLTYSASGLPSGATFSGRTFTWTPSAAQVGTHRVTFTVSDGQSQDSETVTITVTGGATNSPPVLSAIGAKSTRENERLAFSITATDPDGDTITYSATNLPSGAAFSGRSFSWTPSYSQAGSYQVTFIASDGQAQDSETVTISVANVNRPPALSNIGDRSVDENSSLTFNLSATDPDGDTLTYSASGLPAGAGFSGRTFTWTPASNQVGVYDVTFTVSDGRLQDTETITLAVLTSGADAAAPTVTRTSPQPGAIQVSLNHLVKLQINDAGQGVDAESVVIHVDDHVIYQDDTNLYTSEYGQCSRTGSRFSYRYAFQPNESFECDRSVNVKVAASDLAGNAMSTYSYSFLTEMRAFGSNYLASDADAGTGPKGQPATVSDSAGDIWAVWHAGPAGSREIYVATFTAGANAFGTPVRLTTDAVDQCNPDIALAPDGRLYVVWQDRTRGNWDICLSTSTDGSTWSRPAQITDADGDETNPVVIIDRQSPPRAYVAWQDNRNGNSDIYVAVSTNVFSESTVTRVTTNSAHQIDPDIAVDGQNTVTVVWTDMRNANADIYGASSNGNWTNVPIVTGSGAQTSPAVAAAPDSSVLHLLWTDDRSGNRDIYYASSNGLPASALSGSSIIDDSSSAHQFAPTITCVDSSRVFACWEDLRYGDSDLFMADLGSGAVRTNIFIGDDRTNSSQSEPAVGIDSYGNPYVVWTDSRGTQNEIYYAATTFINPVPLDSKQVVAAVGATVGADPANIRSKTDVSIVVPAGACQYDARITIAEILNPQVLPVECLGSYDFGPSGIDFDAPVTITIPYQFAGTSGSAKPYWYDSLTGALSQQGITDIENLVISPTLNALRFKTTHFTPFYLVAGDADVSSIATDADLAAGCSVSATGSGSVRDILVPYGIVAVVMLALKRADRKRQKRFGGSAT
jgi:hypothetical protein